MERVLTGEQSPMFFGSAMTNFGVELFLKRFLTIGQKPASRRMGVSLRGVDSIPRVDVSQRSDVCAMLIENINGVYVWIPPSMDTRNIPYIFPLSCKMVCGL